MQESATCKEFLHVQTEGNRQVERKRKFYNLDAIISVVPEKAAADALHISIAANHHTDYLFTWNCTHINNAVIKPVIRRICADEGYICPEICTPQELMEDIQNG